MATWGQNTEEDKVVLLGQCHRLLDVPTGHWDGEDLAIGEEILYHALRQCGASAADVANSGSKQAVVRAVLKVQSTWRSEDESTGAGTPRTPTSPVPPMLQPSGKEVPSTLSSRPVEVGET